MTAQGEYTLPALYDHAIDLVNTSQYLPGYARKLDGVRLIHDIRISYNAKMWSGP